LGNKEKNHGLSLSEKGIAYCDRLFSLEKKFEKQNLSYDERYEARLTYSKPIIEEFEAWIKKYTPQVVPKSALGKAMKYCRNQMKDLRAYLQDGRLEMSNNRAERTIKHFVVGRKNWLFSNSTKGADSSAIVYSLIETAKENQLLPFQYIEYLLNKMPNIDLENEDLLDELLPWSTALPDELKLKKENDKSL
jgi:transposase